MKFNLIGSNYNSDSGFSLVMIETKHGRFVGTSQLYDEDKEIASSFRGCQYAEMKAVRKAYKAEIKEIDFKIKTLKDFEKVLKNMKEYNENSFEAKRLRKEIYLYQKKKAKIKETIEAITNTMLSGMEGYPQEVERLRKKRETKYFKTIE